MAVTRDQAYEILHKYMEGERYLEHSYAVEAIMRGVAEKLAPEEVEYWGVVGLLHDLDEDGRSTRRPMDRHLSKS